MESHTLCETDLYLESGTGHMTCPGCHGNQHSSLAESDGTRLLGTSRPPWVALWAPPLHQRHSKRCQRHCPPAFLSLGTMPHLWPPSVTSASSSRTVFPFPLPVPSVGVSQSTPRLEKRAELCPAHTPHASVAGQPSFFPVFKISLH